jgi:ribonuclease HII
MNAQSVKDYGADPMGDGKFKMCPSGDIVTKEERDKRMAMLKRHYVQNDCLGMSWQQIETMQGGKLTT